MSPAKTYRHVILPYAFRVVIPLLSTESLTCFKNSSLAMTIGVMETTGMANYIDAFSFHGLETTTAASPVYLLTSVSIIPLMIRLEKKIRISGMMVRGNQAMDWHVISRNLEFMAGGPVLTFEIAAIALAGGLLLGHPLRPFPRR